MYNEKKMRGDVLLAEYRACHMNRSHYENIAWTIGSIFIVASLTLFGISFVEEVRHSIFEVVLLASFSMVLMSVWVIYVFYVHPYVMISLNRLWQIEQELQKLGFNAPRLHTSIRAKKRTIRGRYITSSLFILVLVAWIFRILLLSKGFSAF